jgi:hypothetical protein
MNEIVIRCTTEKEVAVEDAREFLLEFSVITE